MHVGNAETLEQWVRMDDNQVVAGVLAGQTSLFEVLVRRHNERVYRTARAILREDGETEDVMQEAYVKAYSHLRQFDRRAAFSTWLTRIVVHEALARVRRRGRFRQIDSEEGAMNNVIQLRSRDNPEREVFGRELHTLLEAAVGELPDGLREVFVLRLVEGLDTAETAACLGIKQDAVKTRLTRARARLRRDLSARMGSVAPDIFRFLRPRCDRIVAAVLARIGG